MKCNHCGFRFTQGVPGSEEMTSYYDSPEYISHTGGGRSLTDILYGIARRIMLNRKKISVKKLTAKKGGMILDIGAGTGHFLKCMKNGGWDVSGVEVSEGAREYARKVHELELEGALDKDFFQENSFDAVTLWHVFEHIHEPQEYLKIIHRLTKPGGLLLIAVPNALSADARHYRETWAAYDVPRHLWHFDGNSLKTLVERNGFSLIKRTRMPFDSFYISILSERNRNSKLPFVKGMVKGILFWVQSLLAKEKSSSLIHAFIKN
jgi:SAM-dependent methyltransferase